MFLFFSLREAVKATKIDMSNIKKWFIVCFRFKLVFPNVLRWISTLLTLSTLPIFDAFYFGLVGVGLFSQHHHGVNSIQCSLLSVADAVSFNRALHLAFYYQFFTVANVPWHFWKCNFAPPHQLQWPYLHWVSWSFYHK